MHFGAEHSRWKILDRVITVSIRDGAAMQFPQFDTRTGQRFAGDGVLHFSAKASSILGET
jgi:hypothetical protein